MSQDRSEMKNVLFITFFFPPLAGAGVGRTLKFSKYLPNYGWKPVVISADERINYDKDYSLLKEIPEGTDIYRIGYKERSKIWQFARSKLKLDYDFPDAFNIGTWFLPAYKLAREILLKEHIDLVYSSSGPFISHFVAMKLKQEFNIPWVADFRDPWSGNDILNSYYEKNLVKPLRYRIKSKIKYEERRIVENADRTIVTSWYHQQLRELHRVSSDKLEVITNGYDELDFNDLKNQNKLYPEKITITFIGSFYSGFRELALDFLHTLYEIDNNIEMIYIGKSASEMSNISMENLTCINNIPKKKMLTLSSGSDFLFFVMLPSAKWIPGKLFEYLRLGKPILALAPEDGDAAKIIKETNTGFVLSYDRQKRKGQLENILKSWKEGTFKFEPNWENIAKYEVQNLTQEMAYTFNDIISN